MRKAFFARAVLGALLEKPPKTSKTFSGNSCFHRKTRG